jgi:crotonobetainyl-CoA:carnitine CoA-transferase CaiB-like acyl-CoA transferase
LVALGREAEGDGLRALSDPGEFTAAFYRLTASVTPERTTAEWLHILKAHDVPAAPVLDLDAHLADPQVDHNAVYATYDDPRLGAIRQVRHPFVHGDPVQRPFPDLGEHSAEVLGG